MPKPQTQADKFYAQLYPGGYPGWWVGTQKAEPRLGMRITTDEEKSRLFKMLHDPERPLRHIADAYARRG